MRTGEVAGVSALAALTSVVSAGAWLAYGLDRGLAVVWIVSVLALIPGLWIVGLLRRRISSSDAALCALWVLVILAASAAGLFSAVLALTVLVSAGPQVATALRSRDLSGIAAATWWVAIADALSWGAYGLAVGDAALLGYCVVLLGCALTVLLRLRWVAGPVIRTAAQR